MEGALPATDLALQMQQGSVPSFGFFFMLGLAAAIATLGLIADSAPAIIGAMIIAPLMAPIVSLAYGLTAFEKGLARRSIVTVIAGTIFVVALAYLITLLFGLRITGSEILSRTSPTLIDLAIAMAAGGAAAFASTRRSIASSIAGVAIAVALVPPLAVSGIGLALGGEATADAGLSLSEFGLYSGGTDIALGAFLLFLTNLIGIVAVAIVVFAAQRYGEWKKALLALVLVVGSSALLVVPLEHSLHRLYVKHRVAQLVSTLPLVRPDIVSGRVKFDSLNVTYRDDLIHVNLDGFVPRDMVVHRPGTPDMQERVVLFQEYLAADIGEPVRVEFGVIVVDMVELTGEPQELQASDQQGDTKSD